MKSGKILPKTLMKQNGQTLVEFALLLLVIAGLSFSFLSLTRGNLAKYWMAYARLIVDDASQTGTLTL